MRYRLLTPSLVKQERSRLTSHHRQDDFIDTYAINNLLGQGVGSNLGQLGTNTVKLRLALEQMRILSKQQLASRERNFAHPRMIMARSAWRYEKVCQGPSPDACRPRLVLSRPLTPIRLRHLLTRCPNPYQLLELGPQGILQLYRAHGQRCGPKRAAKIHEVAEESLLPPPDMATLLAGQIKRVWALVRLYQQHLTHVEPLAITKLPQTTGAIIISLSIATFATRTRKIAQGSQKKKKKTNKDLNIRWASKLVYPN